VEFFYLKDVLDQAEGFLGARLIVQAEEEFVHYGGLALLLMELLVIVVNLCLVNAQNAVNGNAK